MAGALGVQAVAVAGLLLLSACTGAAAPRLHRGEAMASGADRASVPQGPEDCGNARDDNGNGLADDGCGVRTGLVAFLIAWSAPAADVDLLVVDPKGELVEVGRPSLAGLVKERDCPGRRQECHGKNVESVRLDRDEAVRGTYRVRVRLERLNDEDTPIHVTFSARVGQRTFGAELELDRQEEERELVFRL